MPRLAILNMIIGFSVLTIAAAAGSFVATDIADGYVRDPQILDSWMTLILSSAHGHTNQFALLHICFGLTLAYSSLPLKVKKLQTWGLGLGTVAMGPLMIWRAYSIPTEEVALNEIVIGSFLTVALLSLGSHAYGLCLKYWARS